MSDIDRLNDSCETPKKVFWLFPRPTMRAEVRGESPKEFFRRIGALGRIDAGPQPVEQLARGDG